MDIVKKTIPRETFNPLEWTTEPIKFEHENGDALEEQLLQHFEKLHKKVAFDKAMEVVDDGNGKDGS